MEAIKNQTTELSDTLKALKRKNAQRTLAELKTFIKELERLMYKADGISWSDVPEGRAASDFFIGDHYLIIHRGQYTNYMTIRVSPKLDPQPATQPVLEPVLDAPLPDVERNGVDIE